MSDIDYRKMYIDQVYLVNQKIKIIDGCIEIIQKINREIVQKKLFNKEVEYYKDFKNNIPKKRQILELYSVEEEDDELLKVKTKRIILHIEEFLLIFESVSRKNGLVEIAKILQDTKPNNISPDLIRHHIDMIAEFLHSYGGVINKKKRKSKKRKTNKKKRKTNKKRNKTKKSKK